MSAIPVLVFALFFTALACLQWHRLPVCARVSLGGATVFAIAAAKYPGASSADLAARTNDGLSYLVAAAGGACGAVVMITAVALLRELQSR